LEKFEKWGKLNIKFLFIFAEDNKKKEIIYDYIFILKNYYFFLLSLFSKPIVIEIEGL
jgi:hypothetical protein